MLAWYVLVHPYFLYFRMIFVKKLFVFINFEQILILVFSLLTLNSNCLLSSIYKLFHDGGRYHIETSPLIYRENQFIDLQGKSMDWFLYDNGLRHVRLNMKIFTKKLKSKKEKYSLTKYYIENY